MIACTLTHTLTHSRLGSKNKIPYNIDLDFNSIVR